MLQTIYKLVNRIDRFLWTENCLSICMEVLAIFFAINPDYTNGFFVSVLCADYVYSLPQEISFL